MSKPKKSATTAAREGQLRIIGGNWRGRRLAFPVLDGLRPTGDRIRETLFNWLAPHLAGARCLDLFAGSGALGLEALSRGAASCDFLDTSAVAANRLREHLNALGAADRGHCHTLSAATFMARASGRYDIVFIDPPFDRDLVAPTCASLEAQDLVGAGALVYIETTRDEPAPCVPVRWSLHRDKAGGDVAYRLYAVT